MSNHPTIIDFAGAPFRQLKGAGSAPQSLPFAPSAQNERTAGAVQKPFCLILPWAGGEALHRADNLGGLDSFFLSAEPDFFPPAA
ncbi:MAG: hypothetical protein ABIQ12_08255 [Opitutaceae bacterium]